MAKLLKLRGGTTSQHSSFTGAEREVTVDTDKETLVVHDGSTAGGFPLMRNTVEDTTPQLGGNLDVNGNSIVSTSNGNIAITPNGSGKVILDGLSHPTSDGSAGQFLKTDGGGNLSFDTVVGTTINNNADNRIITGSGSANTLEGETGLTYTSGTMAQASGDFTLDVGGYIILDADGADISLKDGGTEFGKFTRDASGSPTAFVIDSPANNTDMKFKGNDAGSAITALTLDMGNAGLATFNSGAVFGGSVLPATDDAVDLGSSSKQWRDIYTGDINLNNTKTRDNEVDGTRGSWTIQEGENDLFILNRLNGKKYKFKLEEME